MARNPLDPFALGVGRLCHAWADLESVVEFLFEILTGMGITPSSGVIVSCLDFRDLMNAVRVGAIATGQDRRWADEIIQTLNYIENDLRNSRNRYVHDRWWLTDDGVVERYSKSPKVLKAQARTASHVTTGETTTESLPRLRSLTRDVRDQTDWLWDLGSWLEVRTEFREPLPELLARRPRRRLLPYQSGTSRPSGLIGPAPPHPPES